MHLFLASILFTCTGSLIVGFTSPNVARLIADRDVSLLNIHAVLIDVCFAVLIAFLGLCQTHHEWVAKNQSFPYTYWPSWSCGPRSFDFQLFVFEVFHIEWLSRTIHMINILVEQWLWLAIIFCTFGPLWLGLSVALVVLQACSYGDFAVASLISTINIGIFWSVWRVRSYEIGLGIVEMAAIAKIALFWVVTARTLSHVLEPLPPTYSKELMAFDDGFGMRGWRVLLANLPLALWLMVLGNVSELGAGMPGRLFNPVIYKLMSRCGYRSSCLVSVLEAKTQAWTVIDAGWRAHKVTADMFAWADGVKDIGGTETGQDDPEKV